MIITKTYAEPPFNEREVLRYLGGDSSEKTLDLIKECVAELGSSFKYKVCYLELSVSVNEDECDFGLFSLKSRHLAKNLTGSKTVILFAATVGIEIDRLIAKYSRISPTKALVFQAIASERVEALCEVFCADIKSACKMTANPRFSPGYGDLSLESQKTVFSVLDPEKNLGITLSDSMLMIPTKSVTAFVGLK